MVRSYYLPKITPSWKGYLRNYNINTSYRPNKTLWRSVRPDHTTYGSTRWNSENLKSKKANYTAMGFWRDRRYTALTWRTAENCTATATGLRPCLRHVVFADTYVLSTINQKRFVGSVRFTNIRISNCPYHTTAYQESYQLIRERQQIVGKCENRLNLTVKLHIYNSFRGLLQTSQLGLWLISFEILCLVFLLLMRYNLNSPNTKCIEIIWKNNIIIIL